MSEKHSSLTVVIEADSPAEDLEELISAILMLKGVEAVELGSPVDSSHLVARVRVRNLMASLLDAAALEVLNDPLDGLESE
jgi:hypothetical protein